MSRPTKLTKDILVELDMWLGVGCTIAVTCAHVNISERSFYYWQAESRRLNELAEAKDNAIITPDQLLILQFLQLVTRAQARAHVAATTAIRSALVEHRREVLEPYTYRETRLRKGKDGEEIPYTYEQTRFHVVEQVTPSDWRAAIEFLKRRDAPIWNPPTKIEVSWEERAIADIRAGVIPFWDMVDAFDDYDLAADLFARAGKVAPPRAREEAERQSTH